jgi:hypothetical protein
LHHGRATKDYRHLDAGVQAGPPVGGIMHRIAGKQHAPALKTFSDKIAAGVPAPLTDDADRDFDADCFLHEASDAVLVDGFAGAARLQHHELSTPLRLMITTRVGIGGDVHPRSRPEHLDRGIDMDGNNLAAHEYVH